MGTAQAPAAATGPPGTEHGGEPDAVIHTENLTKVYPGTDYSQSKTLARVSRAAG